MTVANRAVARLSEILSVCREIRQEFRIQTDVSTKINAGRVADDGETWQGRCRDELGPLAPQLLDPAPPNEVFQS